MRRNRVEAALHHDARMYFCAAQDLASEAASVRLPAIRKLITVGAEFLCTNPLPSGSRYSFKEFGPDAVTHGLPGCAAPISEVQRCSVETRDCRDCPWIGLPQEDEPTPESS